MALTEMVDGKPTFTSKVHFGYTDGISMTTISGGPEPYTFGIAANLLGVALTVKVRLRSSYRTSPKTCAAYSNGDIHSPQHFF
jgi:hypothetical protein